MNCRPAIRPGAAVLLPALVTAACSPSYHFVVEQGPRSGGTSQPLTFVYHLPVAEADTEGVPLKLILDIGGHDTLTLKPGAMRRLPTLQTRWRRAFSMDTWGRLTAPLDLGGHALGAVPMCSNSLDGPGVDVLIGHNLFARHLVFFDFAGGRVLFRPRVRER